MKQFIKEITQKAGDRLNSYFNKEKNLISLRKRSKDVITEYDKKTDEFIIKEIEKKYPKQSILTEESGFKDKQSDYLWIVDSLDGSGNFANGNPLFSVCIALIHKKELVLSTIYAPVIDEFYFAQKGKGAFLNGKKINVSQTKRTNQSYVAFCDGYEKDKKNLSKNLSNVFQNVIDLRKIGSAGVETGWLASGRIDGFLIFQGDPWDLASGVLLVQEAGGEVTGFKEEPWEVKRGNYLFSNGKIHNEIKKLIK